MALKSANIANTLLQTLSRLTSQVKEKKRNKKKKKSIFFDSKIKGREPCNYKRNCETCWNISDSLYNFGTIF